VSKELWDLAQKECERRYAIYSGENTDRSKYTKRYASAASSYAVLAGLRINAGTGMGNYRQLRLCGSASTISAKMQRLASDALQAGG